MPGHRFPALNLPTAAGLRCQGMRAFGLCLLFFALGLPFARAGTALSTDHPMDGPDAELRVMRTEAGFRLALRVNLSWLDQEFDEPRELPDELAPEEQERLVERLGQWVQEQGLLRVENRPLVAQLEDQDWTPADAERVAYYPRNGARALTYLDMWFVYAAPTDLEAVQIHWPSYPINPVLAGGPVGAALPPDAPRIEVKAVLLAGPEERIETLRADQPQARWRLPQTSGAEHLLPLPPGPEAPAPSLPWLWIGLAMGAIATWSLRHQPLRLGLAAGTFALLGWWWQTTEGSADPHAGWDANAAEELLSTLHQNLYRAFDFHEKPAVYTALERSVHGELLQTMYEQIHASLILEEEGGALCRVESLTPLGCSVAPGGTSEVHAEDRFRGSVHWRVDGIMHHWGHSHRRRQEMEADFEVGRVAGGWRLLTATITASKRLPVPQDGLLEPDVGDGEGEAF